MHFVWSLLLGKIINILQILKGVCKLLTSTAYDILYEYTSTFIIILFIIFINIKQSFT